jgi:hypothetical protein
MSEELEAARDGARVHRNSGRGDIEKGDANFKDLLCVDYKEYTESFSVSRKVWAKATKDALRMRMKPALKLVLGSEQDPSKTRLWVIGDDMFHEFYDAWEQVYGNEG